MPILKENWNAEDLNFSIHLLNYIGAILFYNLSPSFRQLENSVLPEYLMFFSEKLFWVIFYLDQRVEAFPLRQFCNDWNRWKSEDARSGEYGRWGRTSQLQQLLSSYQTHETAHCPDKTRRSSDSLFLDVFVQLLSSIRLIGNSTSLNLSSHCLVKAHNSGSPFNPTRHRAPSLDEDRLLEWLKVHSAFPKIFFTQYFYKWSIFHPPSLLASKTVFPRCVYRANRKWKCDSSDFSPLNRGEPIYQNDLCSQASQNARGWWILTYSTFLLIYVSYSVGYSRSVF